MPNEILAEHFVPTAVVPVAHGLPVLAQSFPTAMDEAHARGTALCCEAEFDHGVRIGRATRMPSHGKAAGRRPGEDAAPIMRAAILRRLVDAAADFGLEHRAAGFRLR